MRSFQVMLSKFYVALALLVVAVHMGAKETGDASAIMEKVAANVAQTVEARRHYVYKQRVVATVARSDGKISCKETSEYTVVPQESTTEKTLTRFAGECRDGNRMVPHSEPGAGRRNDHADSAIVDELVDGLVNAKGSRDGIPHSLFPLGPDELKYYKFSLKGETVLQGRRVFDIRFEPSEVRDLCIHVGGDEDNPCHQWKGEVWIDMQEFQPVRIHTEMAKGVPWGVRLFLGINIRQLGFSVTYLRAGEGAWFPASYGTEFRITVLWGYKRTITLAMDNSEFRRTDASSTIQFDGPPE